MNPTTTIALLILGTLSLPASATDTLRCGNKLVATGDSRDVVHHKCGAPSDIVHSVLARRYSEYRVGRFGRVGRVERVGRDGYLAEQIVETPLELWTYNFGPHRLMTRMRFVDGVLIGIETLGYGYTRNE
jgi:hypothetical protein